MNKFGFFFACLALAACGGSRPEQAPAHPPVSAVNTEAAPGSDAGKVVATVNGEPITEGDLDKVVASQLARIQNQIYETKKEGIDSIVEDRLLEKEAKKQGISVPELMQKEVKDKVGEVTDKEVQDFYDQNKPRFGKKTFEEVKAPLKQQLIARKSAVYRQNFIDRLVNAAKIEVYLQAPTVDVGVDDDPWRGGKDASVVIIEFTDYQCPFCARARPTVSEIIGKYGDKIKYVLRDFPLDFHANAHKAAEASQCAGDQGKYWDYSDKLWDNQGELEVVSLKKYAGDLKLDQKKFDECLDTGKFTEEVNKDAADGAKAGVSGTPSFFINGRMITGARPVEQFQEIIDEQLRQAKKKG
jgi:protein-disulfide isomerase